MGDKSGKIEARLRPEAEQDLVHEARHDAEAGGRDLGERLFEAAISALEARCQHPHIGSMRLGKLCDIPGLRSWRVKGFPLQWFYFVRPDHLDVVRLLADRQDIAAILGGKDTP